MTVGEHGVLEADHLPDRASALNLNPSPENTYDHFEFGEIVLLLTS